MLPRLIIRPITPADPTTAALLRTAAAAKAAAAAKVEAAATAKAVARAKARAKAALAAAQGTGTTAVTAATQAASASREVRAIRYEPYTAVVGGRGSVVLTNTGTVTYHATGATANASSGPGMTAASPAATALVVTAIPATGRVQETVVLRIPLTEDLAPGRSLELPFRLPALVGVQPSYLVSVRLVTADPGEQPRSADGMFWMRGSPALPKPPPAVDPKASSPEPDPSPDSN